MDAIGARGAVNQLQGMEGLQGAGALGDHQVEQIENRRAEPRETSIGSKITAFFKGIGDIFSKLKADWKEAKAAKAEAKAERKLNDAAAGFATGLVSGHAPTRSFNTLLDAATRGHGPQEGVSVAVGKMMDAIDALPDAERSIALGHLQRFDEAGGIAATMMASFGQALDQEAVLAARLETTGLPSLGRGQDIEARREAFADKVADFGEGVSAMFARREQMDGPVTALLEGRLDDTLFEKLDQAFATKFADENTKFIKAVNDWKAGAATGDPTLARDGFDALMDRFVRDTASTQVDVTDQVMAQLNAVANGNQPLTAEIFDAATEWLASSLMHDQAAIREFREDPAVRAYVNYGQTGA